MIWIGMSLYLIQLYADFSGCMDIVLGSAECFGIYMPENFDRPFHSQSIQEFWKRWHITLGAWAQDYIMYPILRSGLWKKLRKALKQRFGKEASRTVPSYIAMLVLWLFMGLWHGGDWKYVMEMVWFWLVIMLGQIFADPLQGLKDRLHIGDTPLWRGFCSVRTALIFGLGVTVFRADNVLQGFSRIRSAFSPGALHPAVFSTMAARFTVSFSQEELRRIIISALVGMVIFAVQILLRRRDRLLRSALAALPLPLRWLAWYILLFAVLLMGVYGPGFEASAFIYGGF